MGGYVDVNGLKTWYDEQGGRPTRPAPRRPEHERDLGRADVGFARAVPGDRPGATGPRSHSRSYPVPVVRRDGRRHDRLPGHGGRGPAQLVGWSDGGIVGLLVAIARPDLVRSSSPSVRTTTPPGSFRRPTGCSKR